METEAAREELILVLTVTAVFFLLGLVAVGVFFKVWHKEQKAKRDAIAKAQRPPDTTES